MSIQIDSHEPVKTGSRPIYIFKGVVDGSPLSVRVCSWGDWLYYTELPDDYDEDDEPIQIAIGQYCEQHLPDFHWER